VARYKTEAQKQPDGMWKLAVLKPEGKGHVFQRYVPEKGQSDDARFPTRDKTREARKRLRFLDTSLTNGQLHSREYWLEPEPEPQPIAAE
jgi:hypothetical protein